METLKALAAVVVGFVLSFAGTWWRDKQQAKQEKRLLAGALANELQAFKGVLPSDEKAVINWAVEQSYTSVYDSAGSRLHLLGSGLLSEVTPCYFAVKRALDELNRAQLMTRDVQVQPTGGGSSARQVGEQHARVAREAAVTARNGAVAKIDDVVPKLLAASAPTRKCCRFRRSPAAASVTTHSNKD